jgi:hypothetical protein
MPDDVPWAEVTNSGWQPNFARQTSGLVVRFVGPCPRCAHETSTDFPLAVLGSGLRADVEQVTMYCKCGYPHTGHPDGDNSCGAYWAYLAEL